jgi:hypothetical protein
LARLAYSPATIYNRTAMTLLRIALLEMLVCFHVIGAAVWFRRLFPRESPWLAFFLPGLAFISLCNFIEHAVPVPNLGWLLPVTMAGSLWGMMNFRDAWDGLRFPAALFVAAFTYCLVIRGIYPVIPCWTEGQADFARVLDFLHGERLPPTDGWMPPYDHGGYYTFQHYGASVLTRLFMLDPGTGYNLSFVLLDAWICLAGAAVGHALTGKNWIAAMSLLLVAASFTGGGVMTMLLGRQGFNQYLAYDMHHGWANQLDNPLWQLLAADPNQTRTRLFTPGQGIYMPQYHPDLGGHFLVLLGVLAVVEVGRETKSIAPRALLAVAPAMAVITSVWYVPVIAFFCAGGAVVAWRMGRRPESPRAALIVTAAGLFLLLPSIATLIADAVPQGVRLTATNEHTWPWLFVEQWWPVYLPWLMLIFVWKKLSPPAQWLHAAVPILLLIFEFITIGWREPTLEKIWSAIYGAGVVSLWPLVLAQRAWPFRAATLLLAGVIGLSLVDWGREMGKIRFGSLFRRFQGDSVLYDDHQERRLLEVADRLKSATILSGKMSWGYNLSPAVANFTGNRDFVGWTYPEDLAGHGREARARSKFTDDFYSGKVANPLPYLASQDIAAVLIWPEDEIPDGILAQLQKALARDYLYIDCKKDGSNNAGIFLRKS